MLEFKDFSPKTVHCVKLTDAVSEIVLIKQSVLKGEYVGVCVQDNNWYNNKQSLQSIYFINPFSPAQMVDIWQATFPNYLYCKKNLKSWF